MATRRFNFLTSAFSGHLAWIFGGLLLISGIWIYSLGVRHASCITKNENLIEAIRSNDKLSALIIEGEESRREAALDEFEQFEDISGCRDERAPDAILNFLRD